MKLLVALGALVETARGNVLGFGTNRLRKQHETNSVTRNDHSHSVHNDNNKFHLLSSESCEPVKSYFYTGGVIDNFASLNEQVPWVGSQRYWVNDELWGGPGSPIFVFIGGEWTESCHTLQDGSMYMYQLAQQHDGLLVSVEHRFYGASFPTNDTSVASLQYLTSDQALADLARLLQDLMTQLGTTNSKVITIGGSYSGNLAAWFRLKYPSITTGSIASSGPVTADINFAEYMEVVNDSIEYFSGKDCNAALQNAANEVLTKNVTTLFNDFRTCQLALTDDDMSIL